MDPSGSSNLAFSALTGAADGQSIWPWPPLFYQRRQHGVDVCALDAFAIRNRQPCAT